MMMGLKIANLSGRSLILVEILYRLFSFRYFKGEIENNPVPLDDTFRVFNAADVDGTTFPGKVGKIDYVMVDKGAGVKNAWIARNWDDVGKASDHWPVAAVVEL